MSRWPVAGTSEYWLLASSPASKSQQSGIYFDVFSDCSVVVYVTHIPFLNFQDHCVCAEFSLVNSDKTVSRFVCGFEMCCFVWYRNWAELLGLMVPSACWGQKKYVSNLCSSLLGENSLLVYSSSHCFSYPTTHLFWCSQKLQPSENELLWSVETQATEHCSGSGYLLRHEQLDSVL